jgi:hypothetical protein
MKLFGSACVKVARLQASDNACDARNPLFSIGDTLINSNDPWMAALPSKRREDISLFGGERVLQRPDDHWN